MKHVLLIISLVFVSVVQAESLAKPLARPCVVFGISDGPQKLTCLFKALEVRLSCQEGTYFINQDRVASAYHLEVESGPAPLVFKAPGLELVVHLHSKTDIQAELEQGGRVLKGDCR